MHIRNNIFISCLILLSPGIASAATILLQAAPATVGAGDTVRVDVLINSAIATNAFSGTLHYPPETLEPIAVIDGNSIVSMWITRPQLANASASIVFAGITPGGFSGTGGILFSLLFKAKEAGSAGISVKDIEVLRNDGAGGKEPTMSRPLIFSVRQTSSGGYTEPADQIPPESFAAFLGDDPQLFDGRSYLVFTALDKGSGVDRYLIAESRWPSFLFRIFPLVWHETASPYAVANQDLTSTVYIKAVDRAGNERLSIYPPEYLLSGYEKAGFLAILMLVVFLWHRRWGRRLRPNL